MRISGVTSWDRGKGGRQPAFTGYFAVRDGSTYHTIPYGGGVRVTDAWAIALRLAGGDQNRVARWGPAVPVVGVWDFCPEIGVNDRALWEVVDE